jgi:membrane protease YdiL (CAAX protease family)
VPVRLLRNRRRGQDGLDPYLALLIFAGLGLGMWAIDPQLRLTLLWIALASAVLLYAESGSLDVDYSLLNLGRGALLGLIVSLPLLIFLKDYLHAMAVQLYETRDTLALFHRLVFIAAPIEEAFFRGYLQRERGLLPAVGSYALAGLIYWLPGTPFLALLIIVGAMAALGGIYGYVCERYGLTASIGCSMVVYFILMVCPGLIDAVVEMLV